MSKIGQCLDVPHISQSFRLFTIQTTTSVLRAVNIKVVCGTPKYCPILLKFGPFGSQLMVNNLRNLGLDYPNI